MEAVMKVVNSIVNLIGFLVGTVIDFVTSINWERFDVRHYMAAGFVAMAGMMMLISTSLQARVINPGVNVACGPQALSLRSASLLKNDDPVQAAPIKNAAATAPLILKAPAQKTALVARPIIPTDFKLNFGKNSKVDLKKEKLTRLASLQTAQKALKFSPKNRVSCSVDAAKAARNGDTTKISSCLEALMSGDPDEMVKMPEKMAAFFIEAMNDPNAAENAPAILINSMMQMMEAMTSGISDDSPKKTATTDNK